MNFSYIKATFLLGQHFKKVHCNLLNTMDVQNQLMLFLQIGYPRCVYQLARYFTCVQLTIYIVVMQQHIHIILLSIINSMKYFILSREHVVLKLFKSLGYSISLSPYSSENFVDLSRMLSLSNHEYYHQPNCVAQWIAKEHMYISHLKFLVIFNKLSIISLQPVLLFQINIDS